MTCDAEAAIDSQGRERANMLQSVLIANSSRAPRSKMSVARKHVQELFDLLSPLTVTAAGESLGNAGVHVRPEHDSADLSKCPLGRSSLQQNVDAVIVIFDHPVNRGHLTLDSLESGKRLLLLRWVEHDVYYIPPSGMGQFREKCYSSRVARGPSARGKPGQKLASPPTTRILKHWVVLPALES